MARTSRPNPYGKGLNRVLYFAGPHLLYPQVESTLTRGMIRDTARVAIPEGGVYDSADFLLHQPGVAIKRGGTSYAGPAMTSATYADIVSYIPFSGGSQIVAVGDNGHLYKVTSGTTTDVSTMGSAFAARHRPVLATSSGSTIGVFFANDGTTAPKKYDGSTVADLGGSPPAGITGTVYKSRLVLANSSANPNRIWFSPVPNIESTWDTTNAWIDTSTDVSGIAALANAILVFHRDSTERIIGTTPPPDSDMDRQPVGATGCTDARSIVVQEGNCLFANPRGVYLTNGAAFASLTTEGQIESYWQSLFTDYDPTTWVISAGILRSYYFVNVLSSTGTLVTSLMCYVPRRAWWRLTNIRATMHASASDAADELYYADRSTNRVGTLSGILTPTSSNKNDANGTAVTPLLEYRPVGDASGVKAFGFGRLAYDMRDAATDNPTMAVSVATGPEASSFAAVGESPLAETTALARKRFTINKDSEAVTVRLQQSNASSKTEIYGLEVESRSYPITADGQ